MHVAFDCYEYICLVMGYTPKCSVSVVRTYVRKYIRTYNYMYVRTYVRMYVYVCSKVTQMIPRPVTVYVWFIFLFIHIS